MSIDGRRRQYVPMDVDLAFGTFGSKLADKWGIEGIGCWMLFLAACKRERQQGIFVYTSEAEAWGKLGPQAVRFTLNEFFSFTGQQKKTRRTRHGRVTYVSCTSWKTWNTPKQRGETQDGRGENPRSDGESISGLSQTVGEMSPDVAPDSEVEIGSREGDSEGRPIGNGLPVENGLLVRKLLDACGNSIDNGTEHVFKSYAAQLAPGDIAQVIVSVNQRPMRDRARYANGALKKAIEERRMTA